ncbi:MAG: alpha-(1-_3)-arabinofuranosyltransferase family protein [Acidimicrobiales bacterium]
MAKSVPSPVRTFGRHTVPGRWLDGLVLLCLAVIAYVPSFLTQPGKVAADTKQYLYLDPGRLISSAISAWNPDIAAGTVTHENIGYLFPMGPYYWAVQQLGIPMWVGQRFWMGSLFFAAGTGVWFLARQLGISRTGQVAAALAYMLTPFVVDEIARQSAIVMPWAGLGWMMAFTVLAVRKGGWRYPALFAIVVALVSGVNATSILLIGLAPLLWLLNAVLVTKETTAKAAVAAALRIGVLSAAVSLWWMSGLWAEGAYGINVLKYTETLPTVTITSAASEVLRGLGYWYFYGQDKLQPWTLAAKGYTQWPWLIGVSFAVPALCFLMGMLARWRYRAFAVGLIVIGVVLAVGAYPFTNPTPLGTLIKRAGSNSTVGLAMRSTNRIVPLVVLGLALLLGAGISALADRVRWLGLGILALSCGLVAANLPPLWNGTLVASNLDRPSALPRYITDAANYLNAQNHDTRVLELPGQDFGYYRWGVTWDPVWPGLMSRPYLIREEQPQGEAASINLLQALDESIQDGVFVPSTLAPIARLFSAGDILFESDEQWERYNDERPQPFWLELNSTTGLSAPATFGKPTLYKTIKYPLNDEVQLAIPTGASIPPPVAVFGVPGARTIVRTETPEVPLVVDGDGQGLVNAAAAGLLANNPTIFYSASSVHDPSALRRQLARGAVLVLTDTNAKQLSTWGTLDDDYGYVQTANETPLVADPSEVAMPVFPGAGTNTQTVAEIPQVASVRATAYGDSITNTPENRPFAAIDGNVDTAWTEGAFGPATDQSLQIQLHRPVTTNHITLLQPQTGGFNRHVTKVTLTFDGHKSGTVVLTKASRKVPGQVVTFPTTRFRTLSVTIDATSAGIRKTYDGLSAVGFAEVQIPGVPPASETLRLPTDMLSTLGAASDDHQLDILLNRERAKVTPNRTDPELTINRQFTLPAARDFTIGGLARISTLAADPVVNTLLGRTATSAAITAKGEATVVMANSSGRLPGDLGATAAAAVDGNPATSWMPGFGKQTGNWVDYQLSKPVLFDQLDLQVVADGRHSIPTAITVTTSTGSRHVTLPKISTGVGRTQGSVTSVPVQFAPLAGSNVRITIDSVEPVHLLDYISDHQNTEPVGLAEVGIPGVAAQTTPASIPATCWPNLLEIDGQPIDIAISGSTSTALSNGGLSITGCGNSADGIRLPAGTNDLTTSPWMADGLNVDSLTLASAAGGAPLPLTPTGQIPASAVPVASSPTVKVLSQNRTGMKVSVAGNGKPFWLVLGESQSKGWVATTQSGVALGSSTLIDGYANGWYVPGSAASGTTVVNIRWQPQEVVTAAIVASSVALAASFGLVLVPPGLVSGRLDRRRSRRGKHVSRSKGKGKGKVEDGESEPDALELAVVASAAGDPASVTATSGVAGTTTAVVGHPDVRPQFSNPLRTGGRRPRWYWAILIAVLGGLVAAAIVAPLAGLAIGAVLLLGLLVNWSRIVLLLGAVGLIALTGGVMVSQQEKSRFLLDINWPSHFPVANSLAWMGICVLAADAVVATVRLRPSARAVEEETPGEEAAGEEAPPEGDPAEGDPPEGEVGEEPTGETVAEPEAPAEVDVGTAAAGETVAGPEAPAEVDVDAAGAEAGEDLPAQVAVLESDQETVGATAEETPGEVEVGESGAEGHGGGL